MTLTGPVPPGAVEVSGPGRRPDQSSTMRTLALPPSTRTAGLPAASTGAGCWSAFWARPGRSPRRSATRRRRRQSIHLERRSRSARSRGWPSIGHLARRRRRSRGQRHSALLGRSRLRHARAGFGPAQRARILPGSVRPRHREGPVFPAGPEPVADVRGVPVLAARSRPLYDCIGAWSSPNTRRRHILLFGRASAAAKRALTTSTSCLSVAHLPLATTTHTSSPLKRPGDANRLVSSG